MNYFTSVIFCIVRIVFILKCIQGDNWIPDTSFQREFTSQCDLPIIQFSDSIDFSSLNQNGPILLRNFTKSWNARIKWRKDSFSKEYGHHHVKVGSQSSIVNSGGASENPMQLKEFVNNLSNSNLDIFLFDATIAKSIPEIQKDYEVPILFQSWHNQESEIEGTAWTMLSLGSSKHGKCFV
jgi:hypothetical protein